MIKINYMSNVIKLYGRQCGTFAKRFLDGAVSSRPKKRTSVL